MEIVTNGGDAGAGSLRNALSLGGINLIVFDISVTVVTLTSGPLPISGRNNLTIDGGSSKVTIDSQGSSRIFNVDNSTDIHFLNLIIQNGRSIDTDGGSGVLVEQNSELSISDSVIQNNDSLFGGGGISTLNSTLTITNTTIQNNTCTLGGGAGIHAETSSVSISTSLIQENTSSAFGGGIDVLTGGSIIIAYSTISSNTAIGGGGGIFISVDSTVTLHHSLVDSNSSQNNGGGISCAGDITIQNSTITNNQAGLTGGGIHLFSIILTNSIINTTISHNSTGPGGNGGGINIIQLTSRPNVGNTIIAQNIATTGPDVFGTVISLGNNLVGNDTGAVGFTEPPDLLDVDPLLGPLQDNGGLTLTRALLPGSPAINAGNTFLSQTLLDPLFDQRGPGFPRVIDLAVDIGAFEFNPEVICYAGDSLILVRNKFTGEKMEMKAKDITSSDYEVYSISLGKYVQIKSNVVSGTVQRLMKIEKDIFGKDKPNKDFYITSGHKIVIDGTEVKARHIPQAKRVKVKPQYVYSICTHKKCTIWVNGLEVPTWNYQKWLEYSKRKGISWMENGKGQMVDKFVVSNVL